MGCGTSSAGGATAADEKDTGEQLKDMSDNEEGAERRNADGGDEDFFETTVAQGESFMASKPWKGQVAEPSSHLPLNPEKPNINFELEYAYGYRTQNSRQNAYFNCNGQATYFTAAVGVIQDIPSNTQKFFGGGEVDTEKANMKNDMDNHNDDVESLNISCDRKVAVSGQRGPHAALFTWDAVTGQKMQRIKVNNSKAIVACALSVDSKLIATVDGSVDHKVSVFDAATGGVLMQVKGDQNPIYGISFTQQPGEYTICTTGKRHVGFWDHKKQKNHKGLSGKNPIGTHMVSAWDADGCCFSGFQDGKIFMWQERKATKVIQAHSKCVQSIRWIDNILYSGGNDNKVCTFSTPDMAPLKTYSFESSIKSIDCFNGKLLVGQSSGKLIVCDAANDADQQCIQNSHNDGEVWGLCQSSTNADMVISCGDDNRVICWDTKNRKCAGEKTITTDKNDVKGASSQSKKPSSQQARAVAQFANCSVVACNDGAVRAFNNESMEEVKVLRHSKQWIQVLQPSPCGTKLAVGSHDNCIRVYDANFELMHTCKAHTSYITACDWDESSSIMRSNSGDYELLFWDAQGNQDPSGRSNYVDTKWATHTAKMAWTVEGIYPGGVDGTYVNSVCASNDENFILTGDDSRLWRVFNNPVRHGHKPRCYRGHSEFVCTVIWDKNDERVWTCGGQDMTVMQWKKC